MSKFRDIAKLRESLDRPTSMSSLPSRVDMLSIPIRKKSNWTLFAISAALIITLFLIYKYV